MVYALFPDPSPITVNYFERFHTKTQTSNSSLSSGSFMVHEIIRKAHIKCNNSGRKGQNIVKVAKCLSKGGRSHRSGGGDIETGILS